MSVCSKSRWALLSVVLLLLMTAGVTRASPSKDFESHYAAGQQLYSAGQYDQALAELERAYQIEPLPQLLINMGRCHYRADRPEKALALYRQALDMKLDRQEREELSKSIDRATIRLAEKQRQQPLPLAQTSAVGGLPTIDSQLSKEPEKPVYKKGWFWGVIGGVAAAGLVVGLVVGLRPGENAPAVPGPSDKVLK